MKSWQLVPGLLRATVEDGEVIFNPETSRYYWLNATAREVFARLEEGADVEGTVQALVETFGTSDEVARRDVMTFLSQLEELGFAARPADGGDRAAE